jgi:hypothetical protein
MPEYISVPVETDPEVYEQDSYDYLKAQVAEYEPHDGNLEVWLIKAFARIASEIGDLASQVPATIFRYYGAQVMGIPPQDATFASSSSTWTMKDDLGYTIPAGTLVGFRNTGDELVGFQTLADVTVPPGSTSTAAGEVLIEATEAGSLASGLGAPGSPMELIDDLSFVTAITLADTTSGGVDEEDDIDYLNRLTLAMTLMAPRPIVPDDFAGLTRSIAGVDRALAVDLWQPGTNEQETISWNGWVSGTFTITFNGQTTGAISGNADAAAVQAALELLSNVNLGDIVVTGGPVNTVSGVTLTFKGQYAETNVTQVTTSAGPTVATTVGGVAAITNQERTVSVAAIDEDGNAVSASLKTDIDTLLQSKREVNFIVNVIDPVYTTIDVNFTAKAFAGYDVNDVRSRAEDAVANYLDPANWGRPEFGDQSLWIRNTVVRIFEIVQVVASTEGVNYVSAVTIRIPDAAFAATDITMGGAAPLPVPGSITGTVT